MLLSWLEMESEREWPIKTTIEDLVNSFLNSTGGQPPMMLQLTMTVTLKSEEQSVSDLRVRKYQMVREPTKC